MFTGVIDHLGKLVRKKGGKYTFRRPDNSVQLKVGASLAVNGSCVTVAEIGNEGLEITVDLTPETLSRTTFGKMSPGTRVNLETPLTIGPAGGRIDGHFVQGHVDTVGRISSISRQADSWIYRFAVPSEFRKYLVEKGAIAVDGISLTPYQVDRGSFAVAVIPQTYTSTNLQYQDPGSDVNIEFDVLAKYVEKQHFARN